jgi:choline-sulfatase
MISNCRNALICTVLVLLFLLSGCGGDEGGKAKTGSPPNLLLITMDTTRADRIGCYGGQVETPVLDRLAREGARFNNAFTVAPLTLPSHASILTGLYPPSHGVRENNNHRLPEELLTMAEHLAANGYRTGAVVSAYVLSSSFGIAQGFEYYTEPQDQNFRMPGVDQIQLREILEQRAEQTTSQALETIGKLADSRDQPFFLWVHYFDPHFSYDPPEPFASRYEGDPYSGEIAYMDQEIGALLAGMNARGALQNTLVAVTADHGESLGEHGETTHGLFVYGSTIRVPLILHRPGQVPAGQVFDNLVSVVDLAPTLLELIAAPVLPSLRSLPGDGAAGGRSFAPLFGSDGIVDRAPVYSESELPMRAYGWAPLQSLGDKTALFVAAPRPELYDRELDPAETVDQAASVPDETRDWQRRLAAALDRFPESPSPAGQKIDPDERERLLSLGYLSGGVSSGAADRSGPDPKDQVSLHNDLVRATGLLAERSFQEAADLTQAVLKRDPDNPGALSLLGVLAAAGGARPQGIAALQKAADLAPGSLEIRSQLANALHAEGRLEEAAREYSAIVEARPETAWHWYGFGNVLAALGNLEEAEAAYHESLQLEPGQPGVLAALGVTLGRGGKLSDGREALQSAVEIAPDMAGAWNHLGILKEKMGDLLAAQADYRQVLALQSDHGDALFNASKVAIRLNDLVEAQARLEELVLHHPDYPHRQFLEQEIAARQ